ncbi:MAG TPA: phosphatidate cytidylyltransferase [Chitinophagales bacterium]|nr:phosphatidate cytidylyltransferase [Chitinophagales bacterium]HMU69959.1 phosphatidate cytidylyltransferase [Chitinophagales bacterium]HMZ87913.1 phosphatidate cytidylyltransferase [Chitinophagales bacterium]HNE45806.1 phosphatidate cytidylyltransferase [Chitinophagales bacterium]HNF67814.1 phosphatidate cytidylyltransferase [Chitinophagales bacterium]
MNNLVLRIITALVGVVIIIGSIFVDRTAFYAVFMLIGFLTHLEYVRTTSATPARGKWIVMGLPLAFGIMIMTLQTGIINGLLYNYIQNDVLIELLLLIIPITLIVELYLKREFPFQQVGLTVLGLLYVVFPFGLYMNYGAGNFQQAFALGLLCLVWSNDTFAYFAGRLFGKNKLFESISPKKTWEGFIGGLLCTMACGFVLSRFYPEYISATQWIVLGLVVSVAGTFGDLVESMLKRSVQIKDSGSLLPGHGGFLDRFDGFMFAVPAAVFYIDFIR